LAQLLDLVIFGGTGDLSRRKLVPALYAGLMAGHVSTDSRIFLTSRKPLEKPLQDWLADVLDVYPPACAVDAAGLAQFSAMLHLIVLPLDKDAPGWSELKSALLQRDVPRVYFLAIPPKVFTSTCALLGQHDLNGDGARVVLEKPLGHDEASANAINSDVGTYFREEQTFRIDHYLGKEAVQNLLALRFSNFLFEQLWSANSIDHIQITISESIGVEGRASFYDDTGALRDMLQNHLLQLLCLTAMEPPARLDAESIREEKLKVLKALEPLEGDKIRRRVVRGQYQAGAMDGAAVGSYAQDLGLDAPSDTETFVALKTHIQNWRWAGVPFYLRTGKRLPARFAEIVIQFKSVPHAPHPDWKQGLQPNRFVIHLQPQDHLAMTMMVKDHESKEDILREVELNLDAAAGADPASRQGPYLRLILDAGRGDQSLFVHRDEVTLAWRWVDRIIAYWRDHKVKPLPYQAGTWGPYEAHELLRRAERQWFDRDHMKSD